MCTSKIFNGFAYALSLSLHARNPIHAVDWQTYEEEVHALRDTRIETIIKKTLQCVGVIKFGNSACVNILKTVMVTQPIKTVEIQECHEYKIRFYNVYF